LTGNAKGFFTGSAQNKNNIEKEGFIKFLSEYFNIKALLKIIKFAIAETI
jgi:hypothetical protein